MRLTKSIITGLAVALVAITSSLSLKSDVPGEFQSVHLVEKSYQPIVGGTVLDNIDFTVQPNIQDWDDGYHKINIGFPFEYNGEVYTELWICINGFVTFDRPNFLKQPNPNGLFQDIPSTYQQNVLAPFWGDHIFRTERDTINDYKESSILYKGTDSTLVIEWRDLNIMDKNLPSSIGNFQVILYRSDDDATPQGDIEFAYGVVGGNPLTTETTVITKGASVGIKGEFDDFLNGLWPCSPDPTDDVQCVLPQATDSTTLSNAWQPSGASNYRILFSAKKTLNVEEFWGDGDVDFSKTPTERHFGMAQNRYVTFNDVRLILRSLATQIPLDSVRRRAAYHGDVNHNGRYFFRTNGNTVEKVRIPRKDRNYFDNLPPEITSLKKVYYEVNEFDAARIMQYLSAEIAELPWLLDTAVFVGKKAEELLADNIKIGKSVTTNNVTKFPVYINKENKGALSIKFVANGTVKNITSDLDPEFLMIDHGDNSVYLATSGEFNVNEPVMYVELNNVDGNLKLEEIRVNDNEAGSLTEVSESINSFVSISPNPFVEGVSKYNMTVANSGNYLLSVYDAVGNKVTTLFDGELNTGTTGDKVWNAVDANGNKLSTGVYFLKLEGNNVNSIQKVVITR